MRLTRILLLAGCTWAGMSSISHAVPVYTDSTYPRISVVDTADYYRITINDQEGDSLFNVSYAWGTKPHVYAYVAVANDDTANWYFSKGESLRWQYIQDSTVKRWDQAVFNKHTMHFNFIKYPFLIDHTISELQATTLGRMRIWGINKFEDEYAESLETPYIYASMEAITSMMVDRIRLVAVVYS